MPPRRGVRQGGGRRGREAGRTQPKEQPVVQAANPTAFVTQADLAVMEKRYQDMLRDALAPFHVALCHNHNHSNTIVGHLFCSVNKSVVQYSKSTNKLVKALKTVNCKENSLDCKEYDKSWTGVGLLRHTLAMSAICSHSSSTLNLRVVFYIRVISEQRQYRMPITLNLKLNSSDQQICLGAVIELGYIQQLNPILLSSINKMMQIFSEHTIELLGLNFERLGRIGDPKTWALDRGLLQIIEGGLTLEVPTPLNVFFFQPLSLTFICLYTEQHFPSLASIRLDGAMGNSYALSPVTQVVSIPSASVALTRQYLGRRSDFGKYFTLHERSNRLGSRRNGYLRLAALLPLTMTLSHGRSSFASTRTWANYLASHHGTSPGHTECLWGLSPPFFPSPQAGSPQMVVPFRRDSYLVAWSISF
ncbi:uncharacterized protein E6C27_scaffold460G00030 [Cucumis melo var. makuwa]|uniref:Uncharacterized protein n=1 Tax=Cucumis melo var. makuwa TaxID=1194695 RepID=A0A5A7TB50_CUCMM|nr:uncharacterized protein E6C27_scaffold460G00030 [Cucumis melo var. makuwa]